MKSLNQTEEIFNPHNKNHRTRESLSEASSFMSTSISPFLELDTSLDCSTLAVSFSLPRIVDQNEEDIID